MPGRSDSTPLSLFSFQDIIMSVSGIIILVVLLLALRIAMSAGTKGPDAETDTRVQDRTEDIAELRNQAAALQQDVQNEMAATERPDDATSPMNQSEILRALINTNNQLRGQLGNSDRALSKTKDEKRELQKEKEEQEKVLNQLRRRKQEVVDIVRLRPSEKTDATVYLAECSGKRIRCGQMGEANSEKAFSSGAAGLAAFVDYAHGLADRHRDLKLVLLLKPSSSTYAMNLVNQLREANRVPVGYEALEEQLLIFKGGS